MKGLTYQRVSLVAILGADKEGSYEMNVVLSKPASVDAARNSGHVIMYADTMTQSMQKTIDETARRRKSKWPIMEKHGIVPKPSEGNP